MQRAGIALAAALAAVAVAGGAGQEHAAGAVPTVTPLCDGVPGGCGGWSAQPVTLSWRVSPDDADRAGCTTRTFATDGVHQQTCTASHDSPPTASAVTVTVRVDRTAPQATAASLSRPPDRSGWHTAPVAVAFAGTDATSGVASCTSLVYAGPDALDAPVAGTCRDLAGNESAPLPVTLRYDATPPALAIGAVRPGDGFSVVVWTAPPDARVRVVRTPGLRGARPSVVFRGRARAFADRRVDNGRVYRYRIEAVDQAGNATVQVVRTRPGRRLLKPADGARVAAAPVLRWTGIAGARYYNVQLRRAARTILSAWPSLPELRLAPAWRYRGRRHSLAPGAYRWWVWPGVGPRRAARYGPAIGSGRFVVEGVPLGGVAGGPVSGIAAPMPAPGS